MKLAVNTSQLYRIGGMDKAIDYLIGAGFDALDFSFSEDFFEQLPKDKEYYTELRKKVEARGVVFNQAHAPAPSSFVDPEQNKKMFDDIVSSMKRASYLGVKNIVVHPCQHLSYDNKGVPEALFEYNMDFYKSLIPYAEEYNIRVAIENMWQYPGMISHSTCSRPDEMIRYFDSLNNDSFVCCLDIGHAVLVRENPDDFIRKLGNKRLGCLHVHDVDGTRDTHTLPYFGVTRWDDVMEALAEIDYKGDLTYEVVSGYYVRKPEALMEHYVKLMEQTGRYLIDIFEKAKK